MSKVKSITAMINIETTCRDNLVRRKGRLMGQLSPDGIKTSNMGDDLDASCIHGSRSKAFEDIFPEVMELQTQINEYNREIDILVNLKNQILEQISSIDNVNTKVRYLRDQVGYSLQEIALVLDYSYGYVRNISKKLGNDSEK